MRKGKRLGLLAMMMAAAMTAGAQENAGAGSDVETTVAADAVSQYIWRGQDLGGISVQPTLGVSYKGFSATLWGSVGLESKDTKEFDITLAYSIGGFNIGVTDYWFNQNGQDTANRYFMYESHKTNHVFEANVGYDFGVAAIQWYTNFAGNDGVNDKGKRAYSSYVELSAPFQLGGCDWTAAVGAVPMATDFYGTSGFAVTNTSLKATKDIQVTPSFSVPVFAQVAANPCSQKAYFVFGFTLQP